MARCTAFFVSVWELAKPGAACQSSVLHRFSERLSWLQAANAFSRLLEERRRGGGLLDLTSSNPTEVLAGYPHARIAAALGGVTDLAYRPEALGSARARASIAGWYRQRGIQVDPEQVALTASSSEAYSLLFKLLCDPGDEVLVPAPSYPLFEYLARLEAVQVIPYRLLYDGSWFVDFASVASALSSRTRAIVVVNPNNTTGSFLKEREAEQLFEIARQRGLPLISDEVFMDFGHGAARDSVRTLIGRDEVLSFSLNGLSKAAGMPQMKLGWVVTNGPADLRKDVRERLELLLDTYLSVGAPVQNALGALLEIGAQIQSEIISRVAQNRAALQRILAGSAVDCLHSEGGWSALLQVPRTRTEESWITGLLMEYGVIVQPGYFFDLASEAYLVVSLITPPEQFCEGIARIRKFATETTVPD
jgi:alanine-synthesizing transaminase